MTNADYYVNVYAYATGETYNGACCLDRNRADVTAAGTVGSLRSVKRRIGVWHVRLKSNAAR